MSWLAKILIIVGTWSLIYFRKVSEGGSIGADTLTYRSDFVYGAAVIIGLAGVLWDRWSNNWQPLDLSARRVFRYFVLYLAFGTVATVLSSTSLVTSLIGFAEILKLITNLALFYLTCRYAQSDTIFYKRIVYALCLSQIVPLAAAFLSVVFPGVYSQLTANLNADEEIFSGGERFKGLTANPVQLCIGATVAISFIYVSALYDFKKGRPGRGVLSLLYVLGLVMITLWTLSRSALLALAAAFLLGSFAYVIARGEAKALRRWLFVSVLGMLLMAGGWTVLSLSTAGTQQDVSTDFGERFEGGLLSGRGEIWQYYFPIALENPQGIGFAYTSLYIYTNQYGDFPPHNLVLTAWMEGGLGATLSLVAMLWVLWKKIRSETSMHGGEEEFKFFWGAVTAWVAVWVYCVWLGPPLADFTHQILLALIMAGTPGLRSSASRGETEPGRGDVYLGPAATEDPVS